MERVPLENISNTPPREKQTRKSMAASRMPRQSVAPRQSIAPRKSLAPKLNVPPRMSVAPRQSIAPSARPSVAPSNIRQTIAPRTNIKDNRQIYDKEYVNKSISEIIAHLSDHSFPHPISPKMIYNLNQKSLIEILDFLFENLFINYQKIESEVEIPDYFQYLRYSHKINKSNLRSITSVTVPNFVAAISWLVRLVEYQNALLKCTQEEFENAEYKDELFYTYCCQAFHYAMINDNSLSNQLDEQWQTYLMEVVQNHEAELTKIRHENTTLSETLTQIQQKSKERSISELQNVLALREKDKAIFEKLIQDYQKCISTRTNEFNKNTTLLAETKNEYALKTDRKQEILRQLDNQELKQDDVRKLYHEMKQLDLQTEQLNQHSHTLSQKYQKNTDKYIQLKTKIEGKIQQFNKIASDKLAKTSEHLHFNLSTEATSINELLGVDLKSSLFPFLLKMKQTHHQQALDYQDEILLTKEEIEKLEESIQEKLEISQNLAIQLASLEQKYECLKQSSSLEIQQIQNEIKQLYADIQKAKDDAQAELENSKAELSNLKADFAKKEKQLQAETGRAKENLIALLSFILDHKLCVAKKLTELKQVWASTSAEIQNSKQFLENMSA